MDDKLQPFLESIRSATFEDKFQEVADWYRRVERAEKAREQRQWSSYSKPINIPRLSTIAVAAFAILFVGFMPVEQEEIVGRLMLMSVEGDQAVAKAELRKYKMPSSQVVYTKDPIKGNTLAILLLPDAENAQANRWRNMVEKDRDVELKESIEFKDTVHRSLLGGLFAKETSNTESLASFGSHIAKQRKFYDLAAPYVKDWFGGGRHDYTLSTNYQYDGTLRFFAVPNGFPPDRSDLDQMLTVHNLSGMIVMSLEGEGPQVLRARNIMNGYRDSIQVLLNEMMSSSPNKYEIADDI